MQVPKSSLGSPGLEVVGIGTGMRTSRWEPGWSTDLGLRMWGARRDEAFSPAASAVTRTNTDWKSSKAAPSRGLVCKCVISK